MATKAKKTMGNRSRIKASKSPQEIDAIVADVVRNEAKYGLAVPGQQQGTQHGVPCLG